jgi:FkbM family methyltransferase
MMDGQPSNLMDTKAQLKRIPGLRKAVHFVRQAASAHRGLLFSIRSVIERRQLRTKSPLPEGFQREIIRAYRKLGGGPIRTNQINLLGYKICFMGEYELRFQFNEIYMEASYFFQATDDHPLIFDCGSNIGMSVLFFKKLYPNARIVAFEPDPFTFETLRRNVDQNHLSDVALHQIALSDRVKDIELFRDASPDSSSLKMSTLRQRHHGPGVIVPARRLSEFISEEIDLLKIDVEGVEEAIMSDLVTTGKLRLVRRLHLEYHHHIDKSVDNLSRILRLLEENGFGYQLRADTDENGFGYQLRADTDKVPWPAEASFQDISIYGYRNNGLSRPL